MTRNIKVMGLALVAMLAMGAVVASAASAVEFRSNATSTSIAGTQKGNHVFKAAGNQISCKKASFSGSQSGTSAPTLTVSASYSECTSFGVVGVKVNMGDCQYRFHATNTVDVVSKAGGNCATNKITYLADAGIFGKCEVKVGPQEGLSSVAFTNIGSSPLREVEVTPSVKGIAYEQSGGLCGSHTEGEYSSGLTRVVGTNTETNKQADIWVE